MDPALAACVQLALAGPHAVPPSEPAARPSLTVSAFDMHLHAATTVDGRYRKQLERVCRYMLRPPTVCRKCGGLMRILDVVSDPDDIARVLHGARAPPRPPRLHQRRTRVDPARDGL